MGKSRDSSKDSNWLFVVATIVMSGVFLWMLYVLVLPDEHLKTTIVSHKGTGAEQPDHRSWSWKVVEAGPDRVVLQADQLTIPFDEIESVSVRPIRLRKNGEEITRVKSKIRLTSQQQIVLEMTDVNLADADELEMNVSCECLRRGIFGRGGYSDSWFDRWKIHEGRIVTDP